MSYLGTFDSYCSIRKKYGVKRLFIQSTICWSWVHQPTLHFRFPRRDLISIQCTVKKVKETKNHCLLTNMLPGQTASHLMMKTTTTTTSGTSATATRGQWKNSYRPRDRKEEHCLPRRLRLSTVCICKS